MKVKTLLIILGILMLMLLVLFQFNFELSINLFKSKNRILNTGILIVEMKKISSLVSAEYYGEVIGTINDLTENNKNMVDLINKISSNYNPKLQDQELLNNIRSILKECQDISLKELLGEKIIDTIKINQNDIINFINSYQKNNRDLVYLARGFVYATYNLETNSFDIRYNDQEKKTYVIMDEPIINSIINPWFIYDSKDENRIPGYEILIENNIQPSTSYGRDLVKRIKNICNDKLKEDAKNCKILDNAKRSAQESLSKLLAMFSDKFADVNIIYPSDIEYDHIVKKSKSLKKT